jgi:hypothetical protein
MAHTPRERLAKLLDDAESPAWPAVGRVGDRSR